VDLTCDKEAFFTVGATTVWRLAGGDAPDAYHPDAMGAPKLVQVQEIVYNIIARDEPRPTKPAIRAYHS